MRQVQTITFAASLLGNMVFLGPFAKVTNVITGESEIARDIMVRPEALLTVDDETGQENLVFGFTNQSVRGFVWQTFEGDLMMVNLEQCYFDETMCR